MTIEQERQIQQAKQLLKDNGYFVDNLWHIEDVKSNYKCDDETAMQILKHAMRLESTYEDIWFAIDFAAEHMFNLKKEEGEDD